MSPSRDWIQNAPCELSTLHMRPLHLTLRAMVSKQLPGHPMKFQFCIEQLPAEFPLPGNGPSLPPCMHFPKPVRDPSSHQPHPGSMWQSRHDFIFEHCRPKKGVVFLVCFEHRVHACCLGKLPAPSSLYICIHWVHYTEWGATNANLTR